jgi:trehalose/maltose hydrolase-like predicted phosphorylase/CheY-like chemotaxis protein
MKKEIRGSSWKLVYNNFRPAKEALREALCTLGNGYFGTRGAAPESPASRIHYPGTYIAGVYNKLPTHIAGKTLTDESLVNCPNWLYLTFKVEDGDWIIPPECKILFYNQTLNMHNGVLRREIRIQTDRGYIFTIETRRIVHMSDPHLAAISYVITPENYEGRITVRSGLDGTVQNTGVPRYKQLNYRHLAPHSLGQVDKNTVHLSVKTNHSGIIISEVSKTRLFCEGEELHPKSSITIKGKKAIYQDFTLSVQKGHDYRVEKIVSIYTSKDKGIRDTRSAAIKSAKKSHRFDTMFESHRKVWASLWKRFDIDMQGDITFRKVLRLHAFHLIQGASPHNVMIDAGLPARGLHGEAYRGHIFWDQLFVLPFYNLHSPEIAKALLLYRYRRLEQARKNAREEGYKGAMFPWQSGALGDEQTPTTHLNPMSGKWGPDYSHCQRHVSFAVAYNVWRYWKDVGDTDFLIKYGAEIILSVAQFGSSLAKHDPADGRYHTEGLMGPDEFHEKLPGSNKPGLRDNAYTNLLITATLIHALEILRTLPKEKRDHLLKGLDIDEKELNRWEDITQKMNVIINKDGIIGQFKGYFALRELGWEAYKKKYGNINRMDRILKAEGKSPSDYKVAKQADVLMIFYLFSVSKVKYIFNRLGYRFDWDMFKKNCEYYAKRTSHGSTLSKVVHCYLAYLLGKKNDVWNWFLEVLKSDIYDTQGGTTPEGIHTGVMGGSINIAIKCFVGIDLQEDLIRINPNLPESWRSVKLRLLYRGRWLSLYITRREIRIFIRGPKTKPFQIPIEIYGERYNLFLGKTHKISLERGIIFAAQAGLPQVVQERILIVDGDVTQSIMLKSRLESMGYLVDCAFTGREALSILNTQWVDLIILAMVLKAEMNGFQIFKEIKNNKRFAEVPVIIQSKKEGMKEMFEMMKVEAFFAKPYHVDELLTKIKETMEKRT